MSGMVITEQLLINVRVGCIRTFTNPDMEPLNMQLPYKRSMPHATVRADNVVILTQITTGICCLRTNQCRSVSPRSYIKNLSNHNCIL